MSTQSKSQQTWTVVLASLGVFMTALDTLVVTTALPVMRVDLGGSLSDLEWTVNAYNLAFACFLLTGAALGDRFGRRRMFTIGLGVFTGAAAAARPPRPRPRRSGLLRPDVGPGPRERRGLGQRRGRRRAARRGDADRAVPGLGAPRTDADAAALAVPLARLRERQRGELLH